MATYLLYVDESGDPGISGSSHLILAGAALFEGKWLPLEKDLRLLIDTYFPAPPKPIWPNSDKEEVRFVPSRKQEERGC
jgi:hypothetical protein